MDLKGKNVIIIGGAGGIGLEVATCFLQEEVAVLEIFDLKKVEEKEFKKLKDSHPKTTLVWTSFDITNDRSIKENFANFINKYKFLDVLVNAAGIWNEHDVELTISVNLTGLINTTFKAMNVMDKSQHGRGGLIVTIASALGLEASPSMAIYTASKHGVIGFTRCMSDEIYYNKTGVKFITICPGITNTLLIESGNGVLSYFPYAEPLARRFVSYRHQSAKECAESITRAVKIGKNGSVWICDLGNLEEVEFKNYWTPCD